MFIIILDKISLEQIRLILLLCRLEGMVGGGGVLELCTKLLGVDKVYLISTQHRLHVHNLREHDTTS